MSDPSEEQVREFERRLDAALAERQTVRLGGMDTLRLAMELIEHGDAQRTLSGLLLHEGLEVLVPAMIDRVRGSVVDGSALVDDLVFAGHYYLLRALLYYTYNVPGSVAWSFGDGEVTVRYVDSSIPRQFYIVGNNDLVQSAEAFSDQRDHERILDLLRGVPEFLASPSWTEALPLIEAEVAQKLGLYFTLVTDSTVDVGGYTYADFLAVYRALLTKALYHRYHSQANAAQGTIKMSMSTLVADIEASVDQVSAPIARAVLADISYGIEAKQAKLNPAYFSLVHLADHDQVVMMPHSFCRWEGVVSFLRLVALRHPRLFLRNLSAQIGDALVQRLANAFTTAGFRVRTNVALRQYDPALPDIDLLVIAEERQFGYVVLACEVKSPLPPMWVKDQLRVLEKDSVAKALDQLSRIRAFLNSEEGIRFIESQLPAPGIPDFDEFGVMIHTLVATSNNAGAFFGERETIIDYRTVERILRRCDGDILYVLHMLKHLGQFADENLTRTMRNCRVGDLSVSYEAVAMTKLFDFGQNEFRSADAPALMVAGMLKTGVRPLDALRERGLLPRQDGTTPANL